MQLRETVADEIGVWLVSEPTPVPAMTRAQFVRLYALPQTKMTADERLALLGEISKWAVEYRKRGKPANFGPLVYAEEFLK